MKINKLLIGLDMLIEYRVREAIGEKIHELSSRNVLSSSFATEDIVSSGFTKLNEQIVLTIDNFSKFKVLVASEVDILKHYLIGLIEIQGKLISSEAQGLTGFDINTLRFEFFMNESRKVIDIQTERLIREIRFKRRGFWWEVTKIALTAIIAGFIGGYIKDWFFK